MPGPSKAQRIIALWREGLFAATRFGLSRVHGSRGRRFGDRTSRLVRELGGSLLEAGTCQPREHPEIDFMLTAGPKGLSEAKKAAVQSEFAAGVPIIVEEFVAQCSKYGLFLEPSFFALFPGEAPHGGAAAFVDLEAGLVDEQLVEANPEAALFERNFALLKEILSQGLERRAGN